MIQGFACGSRSSSNMERYAPFNPLFSFFSFRLSPRWFIRIRVWPGSNLHLYLLIRLRSNESDSKGNVRCRNTKAKVDQHKLSKVIKLTPRSVMIT